MLKETANMQNFNEKIFLLSVDLKFLHLYLTITRTLRYTSKTNFDQFQNKIG